MKVNERWKSKLVCADGLINISQWKSANLTQKNAAQQYLNVMRTLGQN